MGEAQRTSERYVHLPAHHRHGFGGGPVHRMANVPPGQVAGVVFCGGGGNLAVFVQHQFPGGYWAGKGQWEPLRAAMEGCSFYNLPALLRWYSSNIGYHMSTI